MITVEIYQKEFRPTSISEETGEPSQDGKWWLRASAQTDDGGYDGQYVFDGKSTDTDKTLIAKIKAQY